jgi:ABC-type glutathione transport system ATPase component
LRRRIGTVHSVDGVSFLGWQRARRWGWSGESGCGKSTVARSVLRLVGADQRRHQRCNGTDITGS